MARNISVLSLTPCAITPRCFLPIVLTKGHFSSWLLTQNGELCNEAEEMTPEDFELAMRQQLRLFVQVRALKNICAHVKAVLAYERALHQRRTNLATLCAIEGSAFARGFSVQGVPH